MRRDSSYWQIRRCKLNSNQCRIWQSQPPWASWDSPAGTTKEMFSRFYRGTWIKRRALLSRTCLMNWKASGPFGSFLFEASLYRTINLRCPLAFRRCFIHLLLLSFTNVNRIQSKDFFERQHMFIFPLRILSRTHRSPPCILKNLWHSARR